jgi:hypothetical protein
MTMTLQRGFWTPAAAGSSLLTDLVSFYSLANVNDAHASNTLTNTNTVTFGAGKVGDAATFDRASSQKLTKTSLTGLSASSAGSVAFWWKRNGNTSGGVEGIVELGSASTNSFLIYTGSNNAQNKVGVYQFVGSSIQSLSTNDTLALTDATWYHFALTWTSGAGNLKLYRDASVAVTDTMSAVTLGNDLAVGYGAILGQYVKGSIDELGIWNRELTSGEVSSLYASGSGLAYPF